jgi:hypothetical protein
MGNRTVMPVIQHHPSNNDVALESTLVHGYQPYSEGCRHGGEGVLKEPGA